LSSQWLLLKNNSSGALRADAAAGCKVEPAANVTKQKIIKNVEVGCGSAGPTKANEEHNQRSLFF
jgi:hypothetical protein